MYYLLFENVIHPLHTSLTSSITHTRNPFTERFAFFSISQSPYTYHIYHKYIMKQHQS